MTIWATSFIFDCNFLAGSAILGVANYFFQCQTRNGIVMLFTLGYTCECWLKCWCGLRVGLNISQHHRQIWWRDDNVLFDVPLFCCHYFSFFLFYQPPLSSAFALLLAHLSALVTMSSSVTTFLSFCLLATFLCTSSSIISMFIAWSTQRRTGSLPPVGSWAIEWSRLKTSQDLGIFHQSWFFQSSLVKSITSCNGCMMASGQAVGKGSKGGGVAGDIGGGDPEEKEGSLMLFKYWTLISQLSNLSSNRAIWAASSCMTAVLPNVKFLNLSLGLFTIVNCKCIFILANELSHTTPQRDHCVHSRP